MMGCATLIHNHREWARPQMLRLRTTDNKIVELPRECAAKSVFLRNLAAATAHTAPIDVLFDAETFERVLAFMATDHHELENNYNPLEIYFSPTMLAFFDGVSNELLIKLCAAANYLDYPFLLEITCKVIATRLAETMEEELVEAVAGPLLPDAQPLRAPGTDADEFEWCERDV